jgi:hypothetical protein
MVEYQIVTLVVVGSSPTTHPMWLKLFLKSQFININLEKINFLFDICITSQLEKNKSISRDENDISITNMVTAKEMLLELELNLLEDITKLVIDNISKKHVDLKLSQFPKKFGLTRIQKMSNLYNRFVGVEVNKQKKIDQIVFDLKKKQLYSIFYKNMTIKKLITNGGILKELRIFVKKQKKNMSVYGFNIKKMFTIVDRKEYIIEIIGCKNQIFKIIRFIKKYYSKNCVFVFTPKRSFFQNQFKKISSIKRKMTKRYNKSLSF